MDETGFPKQKLPHSPSIKSVIWLALHYEGFSLQIFNPRTNPPPK